jgi:hypothetical protein
MKKQLLLLFSFIAIANSINGMQFFPPKTFNYQTYGFNVPTQDLAVGQPFMITDIPVDVSSQPILIDDTGQVWAQKIGTGIGATAYRVIAEPLTTKIASIKSCFKKEYPYLSEEEISHLVLWTLVGLQSNESNKALEWLLKKGVKDTTGTALEEAIIRDLYAKAQLLLKYGSPITTGARYHALAKAGNTHNRFQELLHEEEKMRQEKEQLREEKMQKEIIGRLPKQTDFEKVLQQLPLMKRK